MAPADALILSCEHGGNRVPRRHARRFPAGGAVLAGHRGWDPGALRLARRLARRLEAPLFASTTSRLLVDLNRSLHHPRLFSEFVIGLPVAEREQILDAHYRPYRDALERAVARRTARGTRVLHVSIHSFAPALHGERRRCDLGLLYDPRRRGERELAARWGALLRELAPALRVRRNYPYRGSADGLTTHLRRRFADRAYCGVELELNQRHLRAGGARERRIASAVEASLARLLGAGPRGARVGR